MNNKIVFGIPEILIGGSVFLLASNLVWQGWVFFCLGLFGALMRFSIELQKAKSAEEKHKQVISDLEDFGKNFVDLAAVAQAFGKKNDGKIH